MPSSPKKRSRARSEESRCDHVNKPTNDKLSEKGAATMKLTTNTQVSVDGVVHGNGGPPEGGLSGGFERTGWARPPCGSAALPVGEQLQHRGDAVLLGRRACQALPR